MRKVADTRPIMWTLLICFLYHLADTTVSAPSFSGRSYLVHTQPAITNTFQLNVTILTYSTTGVVFYASGSHGYVCLLIKDGLAVFMLNSETSTLHITSSGPVNDSKWHTITAVWQGEKGVLQVDGASNTPLQSSQTLNFASPLFVGGVPRGSNFSLPIGANVGFEGCMKDLGINAQSVSIVEDALYGVDISACVLPPCYNVTCQNDGKCVNLAGGTYTCSCTYGFKGKLCELPAFPCTPNPCLFGGICSVVNDTYSCRCVSGHQGPTCNEIGGCALIRWVCFN